MIVFHTDLDNTLIYSHKYDIGQDRICAEIYQGREISFITRETFLLLQQLKRLEDQVLIVPTTTRTIEQYQRIDLGVGGFRYALVCNGGVLLVDGKEDEGWYMESLERIKGSKKMLHTALEFLEKEKRRCFELRFIKELFVFTKCEDPESVVSDLRKRIDADVVDVFHNGLKVYAVPKTLGKGEAVKRFRKYAGADYVAAAGDSEFDISMLEAADYGIAAPELAQRYHFSSKVKCPSAEKLYAEAALATVLQISANRQLKY
ncbi:MAG: HAD hydrolase family protein [Lachnospiraceae bacterium]|nr:HAD hydrolase family protein [Lachnospiraceae bacterium]